MEKQNTIRFQCTPLPYCPDTLTVDNDLNILPDPSLQADRLSPVATALQQVFGITNILRIFPPHE